MTVQGFARYLKVAHSVCATGRMNSYGVVFLLICLAMVPTRVLAGDHSQREQFASYEAVRIGMDRQTLQEVLGGRLEDDPEQEAECRYVFRPGHDGVGYMLIDGKVARIDVFEPSTVEAFSGGRVGISQAAMLHRYPGIQVTTHFYDESGVYLTLLSKDKQYGIRFEVIDGKVARYYAGRADVIEYVEGCL
jgi:hypothetical protein